MKNSTWLLTPLLLGFLSISTPAQSSTLDFPGHGFRINALDGPSTGFTTALMMFLPPDADFAPNVNVQIQPFEGTIEDYIAESKEQFKELNLKVLTEERPDAKTWVVSYEGQMEGEKLRFHAKAISQGNRVLLATATAKSSQWKSAGDALIACVNSMEIP